MQKAVIFYNSKTGTTKRYAEEIGGYLNSKMVNAHVYSVQEYRKDSLDQANYVLFGSWTNGLLIMLQHPDKVWTEFAEKLPNMPDAKIALFTTYKFLTGSMFRKMYKYLNGKFAAPSLALKSRNGVLSESDKEALDSFIRRS